MIFTSVFFVVTLVNAPAAPQSDAAEFLGHASNFYFECVKERSRTYARGGESAESIADAAVAACSTREILVQGAYLRFFADARISETQARLQWEQYGRPQLHSQARKEIAREVVEQRLPTRRR